MLKKLLILLVLLKYAHAQNTIGTISITEDAFEAYTLISINTKAYLINNCGEVINEWNSTHFPGSSVYLLPNGNLLRAGRLDDGSSNIAFGGQGGIIELFDWDGNILWSYTYSSNQFRQHHDIYPMPNGNVLVLAATVVSGSDAIQAGRNPGLLTSNELYNEQIIELEPVGNDQANIVWKWNVIDHVIQDFDNTKENFGVISEHPEKVDLNFLNGGNGSNNWLHINSMQYNEALDQIVLSSRNLSEVWIIDHSTTTAQAATGSGGIYGKGGDLLYRWGNPQSYGQGTETDRQLYGQHYPHFIESGLPNAGKMLVFNNGFGRTPSFSQVDMFTPPTTAPGIYTYTPNTSYGPINLDFSYSDMSSDPSEFFSAIVSSAQELPNGNMLICEGREGHIFEIDPSNSNTIVWDYVNPISNVDGSSTAQGSPRPSNNILFRAIKYAPNYSAFTGRDLTPGLPLELNPDLSPCNNLNIDTFELSGVNIYPNPTTNYVTISSERHIDRIEIYNILGTKIGEINDSKRVDFPSSTSGVYFLKIYSGNATVSKKVIKR